MAQVTQGVRAILSHPVIYSFFQRIMGANQVRTMFVKDFVRPHTGVSILDMGCGPADILDHVTEADYWGFDVSEAYIEQAKKRYGHRGKFYCQQLMASDIEKIPPFDIVLAMGLLHHLDDKTVVNVMRLAYEALKPGGRLLTLDPCLEVGQNPIARFLIRVDRGKNLRSRVEYVTLASTVFTSPRVEVRHKSWIPYTHCFMECIRS